MTNKRLLHGTLHITIHEARHISGFIQQVVEGFLGCKLYASVYMEGNRVGSTRPHTCIANPKWEEELRIYTAHTVAGIVFTVHWENYNGQGTLGGAKLPVAKIIDGQELDTWIDIVGPGRDGKPICSGSQLHVKVRFDDVAKDEFWDKGIDIPNFQGVPYTSFRQRERCEVTLYQDSHLPSIGRGSEILLEDGKCYKPLRCWEDAAAAINNAKYLIYITGWSIYDSNRPKPGEGFTLGELLKKKAYEGVTVLMLLCKDGTGLMDTHDENTARYFRGTKVQCVLCYRDPDAHLRLPDGTKIGSWLTHNQKTIVVDSACALPSGTSAMRRIVSFVGGLDPCNRQYDTQSPNSSDASSIKKVRPREPWHDVQCKLEGVAAWDVLHNFERRWVKQKATGLLDLQGLSNIFIPPSPATAPDSQERWNVQVFRSIDSGATLGLPESLKEAARSGLRSRRDILIDRSIHDAYIQAIRRARRFIYIENQYFIGSSFGWKKTDINPADADADIGADNLIPKELSLKIVSKIKNKKRFTVYIVLPRWPGADLDIEATKAILEWQRRTMEMMYTDITQALKTKGYSSSDNPKEYLSFFCVGDREVKMSGEYMPDTPSAPAQVVRKFRINVHAKMMIVDDEYILVGSANINQRSMDGGRDTEIAMGAYQPHYISKGKKSPKGQIYGFRMSLWYERTAWLHPHYDDPNTLHCVTVVNQLADGKRENYGHDILVQDPYWQWFSYPIDITTDGEVVLLPGYKFIPDTDARVLGKKSQLPPPLANLRA